MQNTVRLLDVEEKDYGLVEKWLSKEHVCRWWGDLSVSEVLLPNSSRVQTSIIAVDNRKIGLLILSHPARQELEESGLFDISTAAIDIDIMIGEESEIGKGFGTKAIILALDELSGNPTIPYVIACMRSDNVASQKIFEKAVFSIDRSFYDHLFGQSVLMKRESFMGSGMEFFFKIYGDLPKQGPGSKESTLKALNAMPGHENFKNVIDVGCGTGRHFFTQNHHKYKGWKDLSF